MGYPLLIDKVDIISEFHRNHIYQARYWEYMLNEYDKDCLEYRLASRLALVCIDQRYSKKEIDYQFEIIKKMLDNKGGK